jgi:hypothetical protein
MDFHGLPTRTIGNAHLSLSFLAQAGPRLVRLQLAGAPDNLLVEIPEQRLPTPYGDYHLWGGHRLWHAPEAMPRSYIPDDAGLAVEEWPGGARLSGPVEVATGIRKQIEIQLDPSAPALTLTHRLENAGIWAVELAPWAITQLPLGGMVVLPQTVGPLDAANLLPNRQLVLWPYARWDDPRLVLGEDFILIRPEARPPFKLGYLNRRGWAGYLRDGVFLLKRFALPGADAYPDFGCNVESYCNPYFVELESLGPLSRLEPGESVAHVERWELYAGRSEPATLEGARALAELGGS